jgi:Tetratricopeptide repeat/NB-ARC domain
MVDDPQVYLESDAARDAMSAGRDFHYHAPPSQLLPPKRKIWGNVSAKNPAFTGRESLLAGIYEALVSGDRAVVRALHGMGGIGKTQLVIEYTHRHEEDYDVVWWINSETTTLLGEQFADLAAELYCVSSGAPLDVTRRAVLMALRERGRRSLLIFDNVEKPEDIADWLPGGECHVVITSRASGWDELAIPVEVDVFSRAESIATLRRRLPHLSKDDAGQVADAVGDLPLAIAQAAGYMALTDIPPDEYIGLLSDRPAELLDFGKPWSYPRSLAAATKLSFDQARTEDPAAAAVVVICAFLAPEPVPAEWFTNAAPGLPEALAEPAADPIAWRQVIARLRGNALVRISPAGFLMHRLTQAIIRELLTLEQAADARDAAVNVLTSNRPDRQLPANWHAWSRAVPTSWPAWARMMPHLLALDPADSGYAGLWSLAINGTWYMLRRGDHAAARDIAGQLWSQWRDRLGADHYATLRVAISLAWALLSLQEYQAAHDLEQDTLARCRRVLGEDHPDTLISANDLAMGLGALGKHEAARDLHMDTLARYRRVLGEDHPDTLMSGDNLAEVLGILGKHEAARDLHVNTLARRRRVLGVDHPDTLQSAFHLANDLYGLGEYQAALDLHVNVLTRQRQVLGDDHPETKQTELYLARDSRALEK